MSYLLICCKFNIFRFFLITILISMIFFYSPHYHCCADWARIRAASPSCCWRPRGRAGRRACTPVRLAIHPRRLWGRCRRCGACYRYHRIPNSWRCTRSACRVQNRTRCTGEWWRVSVARCRGMAVMASTEINKKLLVLQCEIKWTNNKFICHYNHKKKFTLFS